MEGHDADERALERADVVRDAVGDDVERLGLGEVDAVVLDALAQHRQAHGAVRRADVGDEAGLEPLAETVLEGVEVAREAVGRQDELAAGLVERVERVEELLLGLHLALEELDVVDEEDVGATEAALEARRARRCAAR